MRKLLLPLLVGTLSAPAAHGQISNTGLIAHWRFTGNALDSSGNAHHGTPTAISYAAGRNGQPNTAAVFNGSTSGIAVPYTAGLNVVNYSICAILKPTAFYTGPCQASVILERTGGTSMSGFYSMFFSDNAYDNGNCSALDTSKFTFAGIAGGNAPAQSTAQYAPAIVSNQWYSVVSTYNGSQIKGYVNGVLKATIGPATMPIGSAMEGLSIGRGGHGNFQQNPFQFTGLMDDLRLYNRVLTDSEINIYHNPPVTNSIATTYDEADEMTVSPNPATSSLTVERIASTPSSYIIVDGLGRRLMAGELTGKNDVLDISSLVPGIYFIHTGTNAGAAVKRFIKK